MDLDLVLCNRQPISHNYFDFISMIDLDIRFFIIVLLLLDNKLQYQNFLKDMVVFICGMMEFFISTIKLKPKNHALILQTSELFRLHKIFCTGFHIFSQYF